MALPPLSIKDYLLLKDTATAYVQVLRPDRNIAGWQIATMSPTDPTLLENFPCNLGETFNFDYVASPAGLSKRVNMDTSDTLTWQAAITLYAVYKIVVTTREGRVFQGKIQGNPTYEVLVPAAHAFLVPDTDEFTIIS
jgi:hypothetical protein